MEKATVQILSYDLSDNNPESMDCKIKRLSGMKRFIFNASSEILILPIGSKINLRINQENKFATFKIVNYEYVGDTIFTIVEFNPASVWNVKPITAIELYEFMKETWWRNN